MKITLTVVIIQVDITQTFARLIYSLGRIFGTYIKQCPTSSSKYRLG